MDRDLAFAVVFNAMTFVLGIAIGAQVVQQGVTGISFVLLIFAVVSSVGAFRFAVNSITRSSVQ